ncbi:MAG: Gfo/Idh/MocA family oxidoreductase [Chloroflexi bacterium]|nr:Gfo/Idh/MocA family oxidoreductase [Chloroflexota bacterium]
MAPVQREQLRIIHVGVGTRGKSHVRAALESGYWRPVALVDVVPDYLAAAREITGLPESACFTTVEAALDAVESEAVAIASPVTFHAQQIMAALQAGRHVLTEKCFTTSLHDAETCVAEAVRRDRKLVVVQNARLRPAMRTLRRLIQEETYGPLGLFLMSFFKPRGGPYNLSPHMHLWQQGVHELDTTLGVVQHPVRRVWGLSNNPTWCDWPSESTVQAILECDGGVSGTHLSTSNARGNGFEFRLECAEAALVAGDRGGETLRVLWGPKNRREETIPVDPYDTRGLEHHPVAQAILNGDGPGRGEGILIDMTIYRNLHEYVVEGKEPESSGRRNLDTIRLLDAIVRSTEERRAIELKGA